MDTEAYELLRTPELVRAVEEALGRDPWRWRSTNACPMRRSWPRR